MAAWPGTLPAFSVELTDQRADGTIRSSMDAGPMKMRRRFSAVSRIIETAVTLSAAQRATFDTFFATTIEEGALPFDYDDPVDGTSVEMRFLAPPQSTALVSASGSVTQWRVRMSLEILP